MTKTGIPYLDFCWNPCGFGCSKGCDGCWAKRISPRIGRNLHCPDCRDFKVHFHPERLGDPAKRKKPAVIGVQFTGELFDKERTVADIQHTLNSAHAAPWHTYVFLTQQIYIASDMLRLWMNEFCLARLPDNWFIGTTVRNQAELNTRGEELLKIPGKRWLSIEPMWHSLSLLNTGRSFGKRLEYLARDENPFGYKNKLQGVVIGLDNRPQNTIPVEWVRSLCGECLVAEIPFYVKQLHLWRCPRCGEIVNISSDLQCKNCKSYQSEFQYSLVTDPAKFPESLRARELPWTLTTKKP